MIIIPKVANSKYRIDALLEIAILIESGLSFLGIGVPDDIVTWGSLLNLGRQNLEAWWLIIYPGMAIFITITIYNMIAEASRDALDPRLKS